MTDLHDVPPPDCLEPELVATWHELLGEIPRGVALAADALAFEMLVRITARIREGSAGPDWFEQHRNLRAEFFLPAFTVLQGGGSS